LSSTEAHHKDSAARRFRTARFGRFSAALLSGYTLRGVSIAAGFVMTPFLLSELGRAGYGALALATSVAAWLSLLDVGLAPGLNVYLARRSGRLDVERLNLLASSAQIGQLYCAGAVLVVGLGFSIALPSLFAVPSESARDVVLLACGLAAGAAVSAATRVYSTALVAHQLIWAENASRGVRALFRALLIFALVLNGFGLPAVGAAHLAAAVLSSGIAWIASRRFLPELRIDLGAARRSETRALMHPGVWLSIGALAGVMIAGLDRAVAARMLSLDAVAILAVSGAVFLLAEMLLTQTIDAARPALAQALGEDLRDEAVAVYSTMLSAGNAAALIVAAALVAANPAFVVAWTGSGNHGGTTLDLALAACLVAHVWILPHRAALTASVRVRPQTLVRLLEGALNLGLSIVFVRRFGLLGLLAATALSAALTSCWALPRLAVQELGGASRGAVRRALVRNAALGVLLVPAVFAAQALAEGVGGLLGAALAASAVAAWGGPFAWMLCVDAPLRQKLRLAHAGGLI